MVKNLPVMSKIQVQSLGRDDPMENGMATHSSILAWRIPWTEEPGRLYSPWGCKESDMTEKLNFHFSLFILNKQKPKKTTVYLKFDCNLPFCILFDNLC